eukprot:m51a1_g3732 putative rna-binding region rnp-1 domain-containing protein (346) ;mRNA; f:29425-30653
MSTKVFVGNLSFKTREPDLAKAFEVVGPVKGTNIIARGPRSLGYGFVEFEKPEDAERAVTELNKKEIDGRAVNVELARPRDFVPAVAAAGVAAPDGTVAAPVAAAVAQPGAAPQQRVARPPRAPRAPRVNNGQPRQQQQQQAPMGQPMQQRQPRQQQQQMQMQQQGQQVVMQQQPRQPRRQPRSPRTTTQQAPGEASKTTLFVANLPFVVDDGGLLEIFEGLNVKEAHVVMRPNGHSKGYGFVTFENEADQQKAMQTVDKSIVEGREISVRPSVAPVRRTHDALAAPAEPMTAPTQQAPAPVAAAPVADVAAPAPAAAAAAAPAPVAASAPAPAPAQAPDAAASQ